MEGSVTISSVALDASTGASLLANVTRQLPPSGWNVVYTVDGLEEDGVGKTDLGDPQCADDVSPSIVICLFEGATSVGAQGAIDSS